MGARKHGPAVITKRTALVIAGLCLAQPMMAAERHVGTWDVIEEKNPITDQPHVLALLLNPRERSWFRVGCERGKALLSVSVPYRYQTGDRVAVILRIDGDVPLVAEWTPQVGSGVAWAALSRDTYSKLAVAAEVDIQVSLKDRWTKVFAFPAIRTADALRPIIKACPIENAAEPREAEPYTPARPLFPDKLKENENGGGVVPR
jgi:hypothetical protein